MYFDVGKYNNRYILRFTGKTLSLSEETKIENSINIFYSENNETLVITNYILNLLVDEVALFNILGQTVSNWEIENKNQTQIVLPVKKLSTGIYVVKIKTTNGELSKKIIIP
ncbi:T9SS type A sorting domain-containing protein [Flavobacterium hiemivividum]|uniref:T9SS type A sorting domain-containing protein n=1 Tax=Flavobacterium hiemivividum TaxID=2541734 RepID=A0A4V2Z103_9FLAO|nr:T9SS type A sorting domain-containing protein [Flavobacterium hiemivividum]